MPEIRELRSADLGTYSGHAGIGTGRLDQLTKQKVKAFHLNPEPSKIIQLTTRYSVVLIKLVCEMAHSMR